jgi:hypothetical protein
MGKTRSWTAGSVALVLLAGVACQSEEAPPIETSTGSQVTAVVVDQRADVGTFDGVPFERLIGHLEGRVHRSEAVAGLAELLGAAPFHTYRSQFEVIQPVSASDRLARDPDPPRRTRRYELPAPKVPPAVFGDTFVFGTLGCNDRQAVPLNPLDLRPYLRALLVGLESELGRSDRRLPPSMLFDLGPESAPSPYFNDLPGAEVAVPSLDGDGQPQACASPKSTCPSAGQNLRPSRRWPPRPTSAAIGVGTAPSRRPSSSAAMAASSNTSAGSNR